MKQWVPTTRDGQKITGEKPAVLPLEGANSHPIQLTPAGCGLDHVPGQNLDAWHQRCGVCGHHLAHIDDRRHLYACGHHVGRCLVGGTVVGEQDGLTTRQHRVAVDIALYRRRQHDAWPVVVMKHQRTLDGATCNDHLAGAHPPSALEDARRARLALGHDEQVGFTVSPSGGACQPGDQRHAIELSGGAMNPVHRGLLINAVASSQQCATGFLALIHQQDPCAGTAGRQGGHQARCTSAHHQHLAVPMAGFVDARYLVGDWRVGQAGDPANVRLIDVPVGPHEGLVIERGWQQAGEPLVDGHQVKLRRRPAIDRARLQPIAQTHRGDGLIAALLVPEQLNKGTGFLGADAGDAARAVVLEAAGGEALAIGQQSRGQSVTLEAGKNLTVKGKFDRPFPINTAPGWQAETVIRHGQASAEFGASRCCAGW